jgi:hypothetical protein
MRKTRRQRTRSRKLRTRRHRKHRGGDSIKETALTVLRNHNLTPNALLMRLLRSGERTAVLDGIEFSVRGLSLNFELMAKTSTMDTPVSIYFFSDH